MANDTPIGSAKTEDADAVVLSSSSEIQRADAGESETASKKAKFLVKIHSIIGSMQREHGIQTDDYVQYRHYCNRKLRRLRHASKVKAGLSHGHGGGGKAGRHRYVRREYFNSPIAVFNETKREDKNKKDVNKKEDDGGGEREEMEGDADGEDDDEAIKRKPLPPYDEMITHVNYLLVILTSAERSWSHAMELKTILDEKTSNNSSSSNIPSQQRVTTIGMSETAKEKKNSSNGKIRSHFLKKLRKAAKYATTLEQMSLVVCDESTIVEASAYSSWMRGNLALETERWDFACREYGRALTVCRLLGVGGVDGGNSRRSGVGGDLEMKDYFTARGDNLIEPLLRYCQYELQEGMGGGDDDPQKMLQMMEERADATSASTSANALLRAKLEDMKRRKERSHSTVSTGDDSRYASVEYRGRSVAVESEELRIALEKIDDIRFRLAATMGSSRNDDEEGDNDDMAKGDDTKERDEDDSTFITLLSAYDDAIGIVSFTLKELEQMASGRQVNAKRLNQRCLLGYIKYQKLTLLMGRNERMVDELRRREQRQRRGGSASASAGGGADDVAKRVEEIAHLYDALLQDAREVAKLPAPSAAIEDENDALGGSGRAVPTASPANDDDLMMEDEFALVAHAHVLRFRALKCFYVARLYSQNFKFREAAALLDHSTNLATRAMEEILACDELSSQEELTESMERLIADGKGAKLNAQAGAYLAKVGKRNNNNNTPTSLGKKCLLRRLDDYDSGVNSVPFKYHLADIPPTAQPIPCKPAFFDVALNHVGAMPELQGLIDSHKPSKSGGILGWFRRG